jgi:hypothetical protein
MTKLLKFSSFYFNVKKSDMKLRAFAFHSQRHYLPRCWFVFLIIFICCAKFTVINVHAIEFQSKSLSKGTPVIGAEGAKPFKPCPPTSSHDSERRVLYVATCDSRDGWKEFMATKTWNVTGYSLRMGSSAGVRHASAIHGPSTGITSLQSLPLEMKNVCKGRAWGGFLTKPLLYLDWIKGLPMTSERGGDTHVILMDSDTFWATNDLTSIWNKYDCARNGRDLLLSTEMSCWVGRYCTQEDRFRYYNHTSHTPSYSPFLNSGVVMGKISAVQAMLEYVIANNQSYYITYFKNKFDDQYAYTDYAFKVAGLNAVALDYHQQLLASFSIHAPGDPYEDGWPFSCRTRESDTR